ncbi:MAG: hypothetical protein ACR2QC_09435 [Gammaproteobacteria bacterium]
MTLLPWTPDFDCWPVDHKITSAYAEGESVRVRWDDGRECRFHALLLRENSPDDKTIHPRRAGRISPAQSGARHRRRLFGVFSPAQRKVIQQKFAGDYQKSRRRPAGGIFPRFLTKRDDNEGFLSFFRKICRIFYKK